MVPSIFVLDGVVNCLRTRTEGDIHHSLKQVAAGVGGRLDGRDGSEGEEVYTWPLGDSTYFLGTRK